MGMLTDQELLDRVIDLVQTASARVIEVYKRQFEVTHKDDGSPLTEADLESHHVIVAGLPSLLEGARVISEESSEATLDRPPGRLFWLVDPLDGTKEFVKRTGEFTVNVALIEDGLPRLGVVAAPALGTLYAGIVREGAFRINSEGTRDSIEVRRDTTSGLTVVGSRSHGDPRLMQRYLDGKNVRDFLAVGSSLKFCRIAEGLADLYPRFGRTMEWDTAAGHAVLLAAGGAVDTMSGDALLYGKPGLDNPHFVARAAYSDV